MTTLTARARVKEKLDIASTITLFDSIIDNCLTDAMPRLAPFFVYDVPADTSLTLASNDDSFTVPGTNATVQKIYVRTSPNNVWANLDFWGQHGNKVYLYERICTTTYVKLLARRAFTFTDADLALMSPAAEAPLYMFACAEFATILVGNKRKFNIYQQTNGARSVQEMRELSEWYDNRAVRLAEDAISADGQ